jgi:hypothetical protein
MRQVLELRANGYTVGDLLKDHPELRSSASPRPTPTPQPTGACEDFFEWTALEGPGLTAEEAGVLPERLRVPGVVVKAAAPA